MYEFLRPVRAKVLGTLTILIVGWCTTTSTAFLDLFLLPEGNPFEQQFEEAVSPIDRSTVRDQWDAYYEKHSVRLLFNVVAQHAVYVLFAYLGACTIAHGMKEQWRSPSRRDFQGPAA